MKKLVLTGVVLFMMGGVLPLNSKSNDVAYGCIAISCYSESICDESLADPDFAADIIEHLEDNLCNPN